MSKMLKVLRPTSKVLVDCAADVIITYRANASLLAKIVQMVCEYHDECYAGILDIKDRATRRGIAGQCFLRKFLGIYPAFENVEGTEGMKIFKKMMACFCDNKDLEFEDSGATNAVMHWLYEVLRPDA
ncbi:uncharacterized protein LOC119159985 isoform X3 [Rhipicephalus microplus]